MHGGKNEVNVRLFVWVPQLDPPRKLSYCNRPTPLHSPTIAIPLPTVCQLVLTNSDPGKSLVVVVVVVDEKNLQNHNTLRCLVLVDASTAVDVR